MPSVSPDAIRAETVMFTGHDGDEVEAYQALPLSPGSRGGIVWIHHMPGYDRETKEFVRRLAVAGYPTIAPNLYWREAPGAEPDDAAATVRAAGGVPDHRLVGDVAGAADYLRGLDGANGKIGIIGHCSGGRHTVLAACSLQVDAAVDCYGAFVVEDPPEGMPKAMQPILELVGNLSCPLLGLFGKEDIYPSPESVATLDAALTKAGKDHDFYSYDGAGHSFFSVDRPAYRVQAAVDGWRRIDDFFGKHLAG
ncbi:MAG: carboxymethylenebutenolidase [Mycobacterium sp.]|jgi:carboxymethylenebutenolidase|nr:carboxymethylenebutenolidase [Mycobacterium sp.]